MKIYFKKIEEFMEDNAMNLADMQKVTGVHVSIISRMRTRGTANAETVRAINRATKLEIQKKPVTARSVA